MGVSDTLFRVNDSERGAAIQARLDAIGISDREFYEKTGIDRKTLRRAVAAEERVRPSTYAAIESALDKIEAQLRGGQRSMSEPTPIGESGLVEFDISGDFGVHVIVKGPVSDAEMLQRQVLGIIREIRRGEKEGDDTPGAGD